MLVYGINCFKNYILLSFYVIYFIIISYVPMYSTIHNVLYFIIAFTSNTLLIPFLGSMSTERGTNNSYNASFYLA